MIEKQLVRDYPERPYANNPEDVVKFCEDFRDSEVEVFVAFMMDTRLRLIRREVVSVGNIDSSIVCPREIFKRAVQANAHKVILVHNHPSGCTDASDEDKQITKHLKKVGEMLNLKIQDHIIVTKNSYQQI